MTKYIENPKGTEISMKKSANVSFPAITVCGSYGKDDEGDDMGFNETYLQNVCGIRWMIFSPFKNPPLDFKICFYLVIGIITGGYGQIVTVLIQKNYMNQ